MSNSLKQVATKGVLWSSIERFSVQGIQFVIMIIMARLLTPEDYGLVGMLTIFLAVSQSLIDSGFSQALIRKQNRTEVDNSTVFYFNIAVGLALYLLFYISAPWVADFYGLPELSLVMRVVCLGIIFNSLAVVQRALLTVRIDFKTQAKASLIAAVISGMAGIILAYTGFGVWALVCQQLVNLGINTLLLWIFSKWKPMRTYSWKSFRELFSFGSKLLASGLLDTTYNNIYPIVIGKVFSAGDLGHYTRAQQFSVFPSSNITGILQRVTYPVLCSIQNDIDRLRGVYRKFLKLSAYVVFPLMTGLAAVSFPFIRIVLGEKWIFCAVLLQIICFSMMWYPIHAINLNLLQVQGRSDLFLRLEIIKKAIGVSILCLTIPLGLKTMCFGGVVSSLLCLVINTFYTGKLIQVGFIMQMRDLFPTLVVSLMMFVLVLSLQWMTENLYTQLLGGIILGSGFYLAVTRILRFQELQELFSLFSKR